MKRMFEPFIEMLSNEELKNIVRDGLDKIPGYFWVIPASSSGKHHPYFDNGIGGTVRHTVMMIRIALDLVRMKTDTPSPNLIDTIIVSCIFHDSFKNGIENTGNTEFNHPILAAQFAFDHFQRYNYNFAIQLSYNIASHMGRWTTSKYSTEQLPEPDNEIKKLIHLADYIASRKYVLYMPEGSF